jgi:hypothetical protein
MTARDDRYDGLLCDWFFGHGLLRRRVLGRPLRRTVSAGLAGVDLGAAGVPGCVDRKSSSMASVNPVPTLPA